MDRRVKPGGDEKNEWKRPRQGIAAREREMENHGPQLGDTGALLLRSAALLEHLRRQAVQAVAALPGSFRPLLE